MKDKNWERLESDSVMSRPYIEKFLDDKISRMPGVLFHDMVLSSTVSPGTRENLVFEHKCRMSPDIPLRCEGPDSPTR